MVYKIELKGTRHVSHRGTDLFWRSDIIIWSILICVYYITTAYKVPLWVWPAKWARLRWTSP